MDLKWKEYNINNLVFDVNYMYNDKWIICVWLIYEFNSKLWIWLCWILLKLIWLFLI